MVLRLRAGDIELRVVQPSSRHDIALDGSSRKSVHSVGEQTGDSKTISVGRSGLGRSDVLARKVVINPVKSNADRQVGSAQRESNNSLNPVTWVSLNFPTGMAAPPPIPSTYVFCPAARVERRTEARVEAAMSVKSRFIWPERNSLLGELSEAGQYNVRNVLQRQWG